MAIGEAIQIVRKRRGLSQGDVADSVGIRQSSLSLIENGRRQATFELVERISDAMDVPIQLLLLLGSEMKPGKEQFKPAIDKLSLAMLDLLRAVSRDD